MFLMSVFTRLYFGHRPFLLTILLLFCEAIGGVEPPTAMRGTLPHPSTREGKERRTGLLNLDYLDVVLAIYNSVEHIGMARVSSELNSILIHLVAICHWNLSNHLA